jgi:hypothetical protein
MTETARSTLLSSAANAALMFPVLSSAQIARIASHGVIRPITCGEVNGSSSLENFTKRIDFRTNFLAAVTLSTSMKYVKVENNHRGAFRICA